MKVRELIEELKKLPPETVVVARRADLAAGAGWEDAQLLRFKVAPKNACGYYACFQKLTHKNTVDAVRFW